MLFETTTLAGSTHIYYSILTSLRLLNCALSFCPLTAHCMAYIALQSHHVTSHHVTERRSNTTPTPHHTTPHHTIPRHTSPPPYDRIVKIIANPTPQNNIHLRKGAACLRHRPPPPPTVTNAATTVSTAGHNLLCLYLNLPALLSSLAMCRVLSEAGRDIITGEKCVSSSTNSNMSNTTSDERGSEEGSTPARTRTGASSGPLRTW